MWPGLCALGQAPSSSNELALDRLQICKVVRDEDPYDAQHLALCGDAWQSIVQNGWKGATDAVYRMLRLPRVILSDFWILTSLILNGNPHSTVDGARSVLFQSPGFDQIPNTGAAEKWRQ